VLEAIGRSARVKRLVHTSSVAAIVRTNAPEGYRFCDADYNTHSSMENGESYNYAKHAAEVAVVERCRRMGLELVVLNPAVVLGQVLTREHAKASPGWIVAMLRPELPWPRPLVLGDGGKFAKAFSFDGSASTRRLGVEYTPVVETLRRTLSSMVDTGFVPISTAGRSKL